MRVAVYAPYDRSDYALAGVLVADALVRRGVDCRLVAAGPLRSNFHPAWDQAVLRGDRAAGIGFMCDAAAVVVVAPAATLRGAVARCGLFPDGPPIVVAAGTGDIQVFMHTARYIHRDKR